jgi:hypothetical protein
LEVKVKKKPKNKVMSTRTIRVDIDIWDEAERILKDKYNMGVPEFLRNQMQQFIDKERPILSEHEDQGRLM